LNEDRRENPEYAASGSSDYKMDGVMQRLLEVTQCSFSLHFADFLPHADSARDSLTAEPQRWTKGGAAVRGGGRGSGACPLLQRRAALCSRR
jgi:hypothetical protein